MAKQPLSLDLVPEDERKAKLRAQIKADPYALRVPKGGKRDLKAKPSVGDYAKTAGDVLAINPRKSSLATLGGAAYDYLSNATPESVMGDIRSGAQGALDWARKENAALKAAPVSESLRLAKSAYIDPLADPFRVFQQAAQRRAEGDTEGASRIAAMVPLAALGALNPELGGARSLAAREGVQAAERAPSLLSAIRAGGKTYTGPTHLDALESIPDLAVRKAASLDANNRGFVNERGKFMNREKAADYARNFDLFSPEAPAWAKTAPEVISENLKLPEGYVTERGPSKKLRVKTEDEGDWILPNLDDEVEITTLPTPAIISRLQNQVTGWHGSPSKFAAERKLISPTGETSFAVGEPGILPDAPAGFRIERDYPLGRFRSDFINTGEGAQQYSIGTYLAENPDVARNYRSELTQDMSEPTIGGLALSEVYDRLQRQADRAESPQSLYDRLAVLEDLGHDTDPFGVRQRANLGAYSPEAIQWFEKHVAPKYDAPGALYKVRANVDPRELLDWNAPLAGQTDAIRRAAEGLDLTHLPSGNRSRVMMERFLNREEQPGYPMTGSMLLSALPHTPEGNYSKEASDYLLKFGVPGVKYWDEGSREMGKGTRNFVIYAPERDLDIVERFAAGGLAVKR